MNGLSLLGLVCEEEKVKLGLSVQNRELKVGRSEIKQEKRDSQDDIDTTLNEEVTKEFVACTSVKNESELRPYQFPVFKLDSAERACRAVSTHLSISELGRMQYKILENQLCKFSKYTGWHLQRGTGCMKIKEPNLNIR